MELLDSGLPFWCLMLRAIDVLHVSWKPFGKDQDSALRSRCWNGNEVICLAEDLFQDLAASVSMDSSLTGCDSWRGLSIFAL